MLIGGSLPLTSDLGDNSNFVLYIMDCRLLHDELGTLLLPTVKEES